MSPAELEPSSSRRFDSSLSVMRFRAFFEQSSLPMELFSLGGECLAANRAWERFFDVSVADLNGYNIFQDRELHDKGLMTYVRRAYAGEALCTPPFYYDPAANGFHGRARWCVANFIPVKDEYGRVRELALILVDVHAQKTAEENFRRTNTKLELVTNSLPAFIFYVDKNGRMEFANQAFELWLGVLPGTADNQPIAQVLRKEHYAHIKNQLAEALKGHSQNFEVTLDEPGEDIHHFQVSMIPDLSVDETVRGAVVLAYDITALRATQERLNVLAETIPQIVWVSQPGGIDTYHNSRWYEYTGMSPEESMLYGWRQAVHPEDLPGVMECWERSRVDVKPFAMEYRLRGRDGKYRWFLGRATPHIEGEGRVLEWFGTATDIDESKRAQEHQLFLDKVSQILSETLDYKLSLQALADLVVQHVADVCVIDCVEDSREQLQLLAVAHRDPEKTQAVIDVRRRASPLKLSGNIGIGPVLRSGNPMLISEFSPELIRDANLPPLHAQFLKDFGIKSAMWLLLQSGGRMVGVITMFSSRVHYDENDLKQALELARRASGAMENARLYSELKEKERSLIQAVKSRDEFLSIASHELRTPLTPMRMQLQALSRMIQRRQMDPPTVDVIYKMAESADRQLQRMVSLIDDLLDATRIAAGKLTLNPEMVDLRELILDVCARYSQSDAQPACEIQAADENAFLGMWDRLRIEQVLINLLTNALKYAPGSPVRIRLYRESGHVVFAVSDQGQGIAPENLEKVFERYERVKSAANVGGLGLGLFISRQIVEAHGGKIWVESALGQGATFYVRLPV